MPMGEVATPMLRISEYYQQPPPPRRERIFWLLLGVCLLGLTLQQLGLRAQLADAAWQRQQSIEQQMRCQELLAGATGETPPGILQGEVRVGEILADVELACRRQGYILAECRQTSCLDSGIENCQATLLELVLENVQQPAQFIRELEEKWRPFGHIADVRWEPSGRRLMLHMKVYYYEPRGMKDAD